MGVAETGLLLPLALDFLDCGKKSSLNALSGTMCVCFPYN